LRPAPRIILAPNALKGSLTAEAAARAMAEGVRRADPSSQILELPVADGGDGTSSLLVAQLGGSLRSAEVSDPLGRPLSATYGLVDDGVTALIDVATASGLALLQVAERDPLRTTSYGTGQLMRTALMAGCRRIVLGVGGSATVDGGLGILQALGVQAVDAMGRPLEPGGAALGRLAELRTEGVPDAVRDMQLVLLCDVTNPLLGECGAARVFAPQKGATPAGVAQLEAGLERLAQVLNGSGSLPRLPSGGAAGGIAATLHVLFGARLEPGIDWVLDAIGFDSHVQGTDVVLTAEGQLDRQSLANKGPVGVALRARRWKVPTIVLAGSIADDFELSSSPFHAAASITRRCVSLQEATPLAAKWLTEASEQTLRMLQLCRS
jgi:glycerate kinase